MARKVFRLTDRIVRNEAKPGYHADGNGLYLQVSKSGAKSWVFRFGMNRKTHDMGLGALQSASLAEARTRATECRLLVKKGINPIDHAKAERAANALLVEQVTPLPRPMPTGPTFRDFAEDYIAKHRDDWRNEKHAEQWTSSLTKHAYPIIGDMQLAAIDTEHVLAVLEPIWATVPETASRVRGRIERILAAAQVRKLRPASNPATWKGHLSEALSSRRKATPFAAMPYADVPAFVVALRARAGVGARALEFAILTAARSGEARGARWSEINEADGIWTVPPGRMKAGRQHHVPLSDQAIAVLAAVKPLRDLGHGFVFPGIKRQVLADATLGKVLRDMGYRVTPHGFRAAFKTWAEERSDHPNAVIEASLAHIVGDKVEASYFRGDRLAKRRALAADWGAYCASAPASTVVPFGTVAA